MVVRPGQDAALAWLEAPRWATSGAHSPGALCRATPLRYVCELRAHFPDEKTEAEASIPDCTLDVLLSPVQAPGNAWALRVAGWNVRTEASLGSESFMGAPVGAGEVATGIGGCRKPRAGRRKRDQV